MIIRLFHRNPRWSLLMFDKLYAQVHHRRQINKPTVSLRVGIQQNQLRFDTKVFQRDVLQDLIDNAPHHWSTSRCVHEVMALWVGAFGTLAPVIST